MIYSVYIYMWIHSNKTFYLTRISCTMELKVSHNSYSIKIPSKFIGIIWEGLFLLMQMENYVTLACNVHIMERDILSVFCASMGKSASVTRLWMDFHYPSFSLLPLQSVALLSTQKYTMFNKSSLLITLQHWYPSDTHGCTKASKSLAFTGTQYKNMVWLNIRRELQQRARQKKMCNCWDYRPEWMELEGEFISGTFNLPAVFFSI